MWQLGLDLSYGWQLVSYLFTHILSLFLFCVVIAYISWSVLEAIFLIRKNGYLRLLYVTFIKKLVGMQFSLQIDRSDVYITLDDTWKNELKVYVFKTESSMGIYWNGNEHVLYC